MGEVLASRHHVDLTIGGGLGWMKWLKKWDREKFIFHAIIPALYPVC